MLNLKEIKKIIVENSDFDFKNQAQLEDFLSNLRNENIQKKLGDWDKFSAVVKNLPNIPANYSCDEDGINIVAKNTKTQIPAKEIKNGLMGISPWRKGPFNLFGMDIDTEWKSNLKWNRIKNHIDLKDKLVLDAGCNNGYYGFFMQNAGAKIVLGVDPQIKSIAQFYAINKYIQNPNIHLLPLWLEQISEQKFFHSFFDTVFSMGVLYHTRSPIEHLGQLKDCIAVDGELVLETIVVEGGETKLLTPKNSYAGMKNIWFIPSLKLLKLWLEKVGFYDIKILDSTRTTTDEQRKTPWSPYRSLEEGLDKNNPNITIEGLEWGERVTIFAKKRF